MAVYDQNQVNTNPWYGQQPQPQRSPLNQFVWINNPSTVDMWPVAPGNEMTFIDSEGMMLYVKRVDEYNHPLRTRKFKLTEILEEPEKVEHKSSDINMEELKSFISNEIDKSVTKRMSNMFNFPTMTHPKESGLDD